MFSLGWVLLLRLQDPPDLTANAPDLMVMAFAVAEASNRDNCKRSWLSC